MARLLLVSNEYVGSTMAGPGIRYYHFARELAKRFEVTLLVPNETDLELEGIEVLSGRRPTYPVLRRLAPRFDVIVAQHLGIPTMRYLASTDARVIYDLYVPHATENLALLASQDGAPRFRQIAHEIATLIQDVALVTGNAFVCASERQRDLWLGRMSALGRLDVTGYAADPSFRTLIDVVPFGVEPDPPVARQKVLKGVVPGIAETDKVLLWGGGIWNWFDPLTLIRAVARLAERRPDVKLYFLGVKHPNPAVGEMKMTSRAVELAEELGVAGKFVFFNFGWVPYEERVDFLLEADLGVSAHFETIETRFAFRTRLLDYFWAGLPTVTTGGDVLADLVAEEGLGRVVGPEDVDGWVAALEALLGDKREYSAAREQLAAVRERFSWPVLLERLADLAEGPGGPVRPPRSTAAMVGRYFRLRAKGGALHPLAALRWLRNR